MSVLRYALVKFRRNPVLPDKPLFRAEEHSIDEQDRRY